MKNRKMIRWFVVLIVLLLLSAVIYVSGRLGAISETAMMLILLPLMLGVICLCCVIYAEDKNAKRDR